MATPIPKNRAPMSGREATLATAGQLRGDARTEHHGLTTDSRAVSPGAVFVALRGETHDGHRYLAAAERAGATLLVVERGAAKLDELRVDVLEVDDTLRAWGDLAAFHLRRWREGDRAVRVVAVTGSVGKTTTKELCAALLRAAAGVSAVVATAGNLNNRIGVPAMIFTLTEAHRFAVLECGMSLPGEMGELARIVRPDVAAVTLIGLAHAENLGGTREDVAREKGALLRGAAAGATLIVSADDALSVAEAQAAAQLESGRALRVFSRHAPSDLAVVERESLGFRGARLRLEWRGGRCVSVAFPLVGEGAAVDFACAALAVEAALGRPVTDEELGAAAAAVSSIPGRAAVAVRSDGAIVVDDTYNASPQSMDNALASLSETARADGRRAVCVLGEMRELGPQAAEAHDELGDAVARASVGLFIGCGGLMDRAVARAKEKGVPAVAAGSVEAAAALALREVTPRDVVLVKGSRSIGTERVVRALMGDAR